MEFQVLSDFRVGFTNEELLELCGFSNIMALD